MPKEKTNDNQEIKDDNDTKPLNSKKDRILLSVVEENTPSTEIKIDTKKSIKNENEKAKKNIESKNLNLVKPTNKNEKISIWIILFSFIIGLAIGSGIIGGIFYYKSKVENVNLTPTPLQEENTTPSNENSPLSSPSPISEIDYSKYKLQILNGSGIKGEAASVEKLLKPLGFTKITTGNASSYNYKETEILIKEEIPEKILESLKTSLEKYKLKISNTLKTETEFDIIITVGNTKI